MSRMKGSHHQPDTASRQSQGATVTEEQGRMAAAAGRSWAEQKAERLEGEIPAVDWPDFWQPEWSGKLPFDSSRLDSHGLAALQALANHAAVEQWQELVFARRADEDAEDEEIEMEVDAARLFESVRNSLPDGLRAVRDGERVYLVDYRGTERTITSLPQAVRVIDEWREGRSL